MQKTTGKRKTEKEKTKGQKLLCTLAQLATGADPTHLGPLSPSSCSPRVVAEIPRPWPHHAAVAAIRRLPARIRFPSRPLANPSTLPISPFIPRSPLSRSGSEPSAAVAVAPKSSRPPSSPSCAKASRRTGALVLVHLEHQDEPDRPAARRRRRPSPRTLLCFVISLEAPDAPGPPRVLPSRQQPPL